MHITATHSCAIMEIDGLAGYQDKPKEALVNFCKLSLDTLVRYRGFTPQPKSLYSFYLFTSACEGLKADDNYGHQFCEFIREQKLGPVWVSPTVVNKVFHPSHANQVYVWQPDHAALVAWWNEFKNPKPKPEPTMVATVNVPKGPVLDPEYPEDPEDEDLEDDEELYFDDPRDYDEIDYDNEGL